MHSHLNPDNVKKRDDRVQKANKTIEGLKETIFKLEKERDNLKATNDLHNEESKTLKKVFVGKYFLATNAEIFTKTGRTWEFRDSKEFDALFKLYANKYFK